MQKYEKKSKMWNKSFFMESKSRCVCIKNVIVEKKMIRFSAVFQMLSVICFFGMYFYEKKVVAEFFFL